MKLFQNLFKIIFFTLLFSQYLFASPKEELSPSIKFFQVKYHFGNAITSPLEYSNSTWKYYYQFFENYAVFKLADIKNGQSEIKVTPDVTIKENYIVLIDMKASPRKVIFARTEDDLYYAATGGGGETGSEILDDYPQTRGLAEVIDFYVKKNGKTNYTGDIDYFAIETDRATTLNIDFTQSKANGYYSILDYRGQPLDKRYYQNNHNNFFDGDIQHVDLPSDGRYFISIRKAFSTDKTNEYSFSISCNQCQKPIDIEPNRINDTKKLIIPNNSTISGSIDFPGDIDVFEYTSNGRSGQFCFIIKDTTSKEPLWAEFYNIQEKNSFELSPNQKGERCFTIPSMTIKTYYISIANSYGKKSKYSIQAYCKYCSDEASNDSDFFDLPFKGTAVVTAGNNDQVENATHKDHTSWDNSYAIDWDLDVTSYNIVSPTSGNIICLYDENHNGGKNCPNPKKKNGCLSGGRVIVIQDDNGFYPTLLHFNKFSQNIVDKFNQDGNVRIEKGTILGKVGGSKGEDYKCINGQENGGTGYKNHIHFHLWTGSGNPDSHTKKFAEIKPLRVKIDGVIKKLWGQDLDDDKIYKKNMMSLQ